MLTLAIAGRPNVGKSTLFNTLAGKQLAITDDTPGITRDWREADGQLIDIPLRLIDTAGLEEANDDSIPARMRRQTEAALAQADAILFLVDGRAGLTPLDTHFARWLLKQKLPVLLGINKAENESAVAAALAESYALGLGDPILLSAAHRLGLDELYDRLVPLAKKKQEEDEQSAQDDNSAENGGFAAYIGDLDALEGDEDFDFAANAKQDDLERDTEKPIKIALVGRPNAGKSTLMNRYLGFERSMTGPEAGITRDAIAQNWRFEDQLFRLVDTAGMRRKARINDKIEKMSVDDSLRAIRLAQIVILLLDAERGLEKQDLAIARHVAEEGRILVIAVNKWDAVKDQKTVLQDIEFRLQRSFGQIKDLPVVPISALTGKHTDKVMRQALAAFDRWNARVPTGPLNRWMRMMESRHPPPMTDGLPNRLKYITQIKSRPPTFALWVSRSEAVDESYQRFLINGLATDFGMEGIPIRLHIRVSKNPYANKKKKR